VAMETQFSPTNASGSSAFITALPERQNCNSDLLQYVLQVMSPSACSFIALHDLQYPLNNTVQQDAKI
jgi:hypothetical protein